MISGFAEAISKERADLVVSFASARERDLGAGGSRPARPLGDGELGRRMRLAPGVKLARAADAAPAARHARAIGDTLLAGRDGRSRRQTMPEGSLPTGASRRTTGPTQTGAQALGRGGTFFDTPAREPRTSRSAAGSPTSQFASAKLDGSGDHAPRSPFRTPSWVMAAGPRLPWLQEIAASGHASFSWNSWIELSFATAEAHGRHASGTSSPSRRVPVGLDHVFGVPARWHPRRCRGHSDWPGSQPSASSPR